MFFISSDVASAVSKKSCTTTKLHRLTLTDRLPMTMYGITVMPSEHRNSLAVPPRADTEFNAVNRSVVFCCDAAMALRCRLVSAGCCGRDCCCCCIGEEARPPCVGCG